MKKYSLFGFLLFSTVACLILSCKKSIESSPNVSKEIILPQNGNLIVRANNQFAFDFLRAVVQNDNTPGNKLISPLSIHLALSMAYNGANTATKDSMLHALRLDNVTNNDLNKTYQSVIEQIPDADSKINISIANSIWYRQEMQPLPDFLNVTNSCYHATINPLDFNSANAVNTINKWVSDNTKGKITQILDRIDGNDLMFLINAIYFKGTWKHQFNKNATANSDFYTDDHKIVSTPFMYLLDTINYFGNDSMQMIQLPYGNGNFNMYIIVPKTNVSVEDFASYLSSSSLENWQANLQKLSLKLYLPKFKYSYSIGNMKPALTKLGMGIAFNDNADFSKMYSTPVRISKAVHKTFIEVNEEGTEAAAVTSIGMAVTTIGNGPKVFKVDHPFLFTVQEKTSGLVLFTGILNNPSSQN